MLTVTSTPGAITEARPKLDLALTHIYFDPLLANETLGPELPTPVTSGVKSAQLERLAVPTS